MLKNYLLKHSTLKFERDANNYTTDSNKRFATYKALDFETCKYQDKSEDLVIIDGSLHRFFNDGGDNANDFKLSALIKTALEFCKQFEIPPNIVKLQSPEFGLNIDLGFKPDEEFFDKFIVLQSDGGSVRPSTIDSKDKNGYKLGRYFTISDQYHFKIYHKVGNILRVEVRILKTQKLRMLHGLKNYNPTTFLEFLNPEVIQIIGNLILDTFDKILVDEHISDGGDISDDDYKTYLILKNPTTWRKGNLNKEERRKAKIKIQDLLDKYGHDSVKQTIHGLLKDKLEECLEMDKESLECFKILKAEDFLTIYNREIPPDYHSIESNLVEESRPCYSPDDLFNSIVKSLDEIYFEQVNLSLPPFNKFKRKLADFKANFIWAIKENKYLELGD
ncbi:hypothetical protein NPE20_07175 [Mucilaginibacter sp. JC4]|uniref:Nucleotidyltransferase n=1 Tax=Mucilaginibacter aquariorum TaxID=2967225 RepID=A0ABT1SZE8_9SPHI|nr:hypothetical protein [Mucilaginibacter aquariorum]